jgi:hypothetical protein
VPSSKKGQSPKAPARSANYRVQPTLANGHLPLKSLPDNSHQAFKDEMWLVGLPRFRSRTPVAHPMQMLLIAWTVSI